ncbi:nicotinate (nicotinamide) nucleotide adenylyltransferase [Desulfogranum japonicum]|uniref:nicotinate (nicotinamide) nucleotide adenylyltransferase n=1 Tax=Desulfogranum japonicum TaxID=231447 RepID=UPI00041A9466|nr:nicotinate (nicotinamide) nucleotide adenylyltransferase [Desulfogranum japonicum]
MSCQQEVGLFGGSFDPVHNGHIAIGRYVLMHHCLREILYIPAPSPPHKNSLGASFAHRVAMLELALHNEPHLHISLIENEYEGPSYTVETIEKLMARNPHTRYSMIIGGDSLKDLGSWYCSERILSLVNIIVVGRDLMSSSYLERCIISLKPAFRWHRESNSYLSDVGTSLVCHGNLHLPISSSQVRADLSHNRCPAEVNPAVYSYIREHNLYR